MPRGRPEIAASILTADFAHLDRVVKKLERAGVDRLHLDVMDGHFVPNLTFGPDIVAAFRRITDLPLDLHLMVSDPGRLLGRYLEASPETITFHVEALADPGAIGAVLEGIRDGGALPGLAIRPSTPVDAILPWAGILEVVMIMTVEPGFGGQRFISAAAPKIAEAAAAFAARGRRPAIHVDGGVNRDTAHVAGAWGAEVCIVGSALFQRGRDASDEVAIVREGILRGRSEGPPAPADAPPAGNGRG